MLYNRKAFAVVEKLAVLEILIVETLTAAITVANQSLKNLSEKCQIIDLAFTQRGISVF